MSVATWPGRSFALSGAEQPKSKCEFFKDSVKYLGHSVNVQGLYTLPSKVEAILKAPDPKNQQLRSFLGLHNYGKFAQT